MTLAHRSVLAAALLYLSAGAPAKDLGYTASPRAAHQACVAQTTESAAHVIELYTSEGCSSCPPAERWLHQLTTADPGIRALEFHVDYWDSLGWRDIYADARYTARQQQLASGRSAPGVYTPEVIVDGHEWRDWYREVSPSRAAPDASLALSLGIVSEAPLTMRLGLTGDVPSEPYRWYLAVTESDLSRAIAAGENRGSTLRHENVVRSFTGPMRIDGASHEVDIPAGMDFAHADLVAIVVNAADSSALQAIALPLAGCAP